jgi:hypothetical protein
MHRTLVALATTAILLICAPASMAWSGAKINSVSCPEIHTVLPVENGPWKVLAVDELGHTLVNVNVPGSSAEQIIGGLWLLDNGTHQVKVTVGNAANIADGKVTRTTQMTNCAAPVGPPGPKGDPGPPGIGYDCTGTAVSTGGTPALCPGTPGRDGVTKTIIIRQAPKSCESTRSYAFRVRQTYMGQKVVSVKAAYEAPKGEESIKAKVTRERGRLVVRWSTKGVKFTPGGVVRSVTVHAKLANGKNVRLQWLFRPCMGKNGKLNDPAAAGQGSGGGTTAAIT